MSALNSVTMKVLPGTGERDETGASGFIARSGNVIGTGWYVHTFPHVRRTTPLGRRQTGNCTLNDPAVSRSAQLLPLDRKSDPQDVVADRGGLD